MIPNVRTRLFWTLVASLCLVACAPEEAPAPIAPIATTRPPDNVQLEKLPVGTEIEGKVISVADGDTLTLVIETKNPDGEPAREFRRIRLDGIDSPETKQAFGIEAKRALEQRALDKQLTATVTDTDRYGRTVARLHRKKGDDLNVELVAKGYAWWYRRYAPNDKALEKAEKAAKSAKIGLWSLPKPIPPWDYRRMSPKPAEAPARQAK